MWLADCRNRNICVCQQSNLPAFVLKYTPTISIFHLNNYLTRVRLSVSLFVCSFVCLSVAMVPTWRHLQSGAAQTVASCWVKFAQFVEHELGHLHVEKRGRWGARWARGTSWKSANLRHRVYMLKSRREIGEKCEKAISTGGFPGRYLGDLWSDWQATNTDV